jgi:hypothetical protein
MNPALQNVAAGSPGSINPAPVLDNLSEFLSPKGCGVGHLRIYGVQSVFLSQLVSLPSRTAVNKSTYSERLGAILSIGGAARDVIGKGTTTAERC